MVTRCRILLESQEKQCDRAMLVRKERECDNLAKFGTSSSGCEPARPMGEPPEPVANLATVVVTRPSVMSIPPPIWSARSPEGSARPVHVSNQLRNPFALVISVLSILPMAQLIVRNIDQILVDLLKRQAAEHGRSAEAEHREILRAALQPQRSGSLKDHLLAMPDVGDDADFAIKRS